MCEQDRVDNLLRSVQHYVRHFKDDTTFALIGGGPDQQRLQQLSSSMGLSSVVHFTGRVSDEVLWSYFSTADVCVDPDPFTVEQSFHDEQDHRVYGFRPPHCRLSYCWSTTARRKVPLFTSLPMTPSHTQVTIRELLKDTARRETMSAFGRERFLNALCWENSCKQLLPAYESLLGSQATETAQPARNAHS